MKSKDKSLIEKLERAIKGVEFISETYAPFTVIVSDEPVARTTAALKKVFGLDGKNFEEIPFDDFFDRLTRDRDWHQTADKKQIAKYKKIRSTLETDLEDLRVLRLGRVQIDIYIVGFLPDNQAVGIRTKAIET